MVSWCKRHSYMNVDYWSWRAQSTCVATYAIHPCTAMYMCITRASCFWLLLDWTGRGEDVPVKYPVMVFIRTHGRGSSTQAYTYKYRTTEQSIRRVFRVESISSIYEHQPLVSTNHQFASLFGATEGSVKKCILGHYYNLLLIGPIQVSSWQWSHTLMMKASQSWCS